MLPFRRRHKYEVFLSHAVEDREIIVGEIHARLDLGEVKMWYSATSLKPGEILNDAIKKAVTESRFGVVILTKNSIDRDWPTAELNWLEMQNKNGKRVVLPVLHDLEIEALPPRIRILAEKYCLRTTRGMDFVIGKILEEIKVYRDEEKRRRIYEWLISIGIGVVILLSIFLWINNRPADAEINHAINDRIQVLTNSIRNNYIAPSKLRGARVTQIKIDSARLAYQNYRSYFRNEYEFNSGLSVVRSRKNVQSVLDIDVVEISDSPGYGIDSVDIYWSSTKMQNGFHQSSFSLINKRSISFSFTARRDGSQYIVAVHYGNNIQYINVTLTTPPTSVGTKRHEMTIVGVPPLEIYNFEKSAEGEWRLKEIRQEAIQ